MKAKHCMANIVLVLALPLVSLATPAEQKSESAVAEKCRQTRASALATFSEPPQIGEVSSPGERARARLDRAVVICAKAAETLRDSALAAEMKAEEYLARAALAPGHPEPGQRWRGEILIEGIEAVRGLHNDRSPASVELLRRAGFRYSSEDPEYGQELLELAVDIAREAFGTKDPRYADELRHLATLHAPNPLHARTGTELADPDPGKAERLLRESLAIYLLRDSPARFDGYRQTLVMLKGLFEATGREQDARELDDLVADAYREQQRDAEAQKEDPEPRVPPGGGTAGLWQPRAARPALWRLERSRSSRTYSRRILGSKS